MDDSIHLLDLARWLMGDAADAEVQRALGPDGGVAYAVLLRFTSGAVGTLHPSTTRSWRIDNERVAITGAGPAVAVENIVRSVYRTAGGSPGALWKPSFPVPSNDNRLLTLAGYAPEPQHSLEVAEGEETPRATIDDAVPALRLVDRTYEAVGVGPRPMRAGSAW